MNPPGPRDKVQYLSLHNGPFWIDATVTHTYLVDGVLGRADINLAHGTEWPQRCGVAVERLRPRVCAPPPVRLFLPTHIRGCRVLVEEQGAPNRWRVDNATLRSRSPGIAFRLEKCLGATHAKFFASWDEVVPGFSDGDGWLCRQLCVPTACPAVAQPMRPEVEWAPPAPEPEPMPSSSTTALAFASPAPQPTPQPKACEPPGADEAGVQVADAEPAPQSEKRRREPEPQVS